MSAVFSTSRVTLSRLVTASVAAVLIVASALIAVPAQAATSTLEAPNGISYSLDDATHTAIASSYAYWGAPDVEIAATVVGADLATYRVTAIGSYSFNGKSLTSITLPEGLT